MVCQYGESIVESVRRAAEMCESLQSFFLLHSLGGGTGSGLGTYILSLLEDNFPEVRKYKAWRLFGSQAGDSRSRSYDAFEGWGDPHRPTRLPLITLTKDEA
jgi:tubulin epsilon